MTTVGLLHTSTYTAIELVSRLVAPPACACGSEIRGSNPFGCAHVMSRDIADGVPGTSLHFQRFGVVRI